MKENEPRERWEIKYRWRRTGPKTGLFGLVMIAIVNGKEMPIDDMVALLREKADV